MTIAPLPVIVAVAEAEFAFGANVTEPDGVALQAENVYPLFGVAVIEIGVPECNV